jgi:hypothetical protein
MAALPGFLVSLIVQYAKANLHRELQDEPMDGLVGWAKALLAPCPREVARQIEPLRVGTADPAW